MKLSAPIYKLKSKAKKLKKNQSISMAEALNIIAQGEGFSSWSLLQSKAMTLSPSRKEDILHFLNGGDLMLIGSRPGLGKTSFTLELLLQAVKEHRKCFFFSLEYTHRDVASKVAKIDNTIGINNEFLAFDFSDEISADYIIKRLEGEVEENAVIAVDYLQLLDQKRSNPMLQDQVKDLKEFARSKKVIILLISQLDRSFDVSERIKPSLKDIRLPNPLDLKLFNKTLFLHNGQKFFSASSTFKIF